MSDSVRNHWRRNAAAMLAAVLVAFSMLAAAPATADDGDGGTSPITVPLPDPDPVDPDPVDPAPVDPAPVDPAPVDPAPADPPAATAPDTPGTSSGTSSTSPPKHSTPVKHGASTKHHSQHDQTQAAEESQPQALTAYEAVSPPEASPSAVTAETQHRTVLQRLTTPSSPLPVETSPAPEAPEAGAVTTTARLVSSPTSTAGALSLWVPALLLGLFLAVTGATLHYRWRTGELLWRGLPKRLRNV